jgi:hypothetical protein
MAYFPYVKLPEGIKKTHQHKQTILLQGTIGNGSDLLGKYHDLPTQNGGLFWPLPHIIAKCLCGELFPRS